MMKSSISMLLLASVSASTLLISSPAHADKKIDATKTITWDIPKVPDANNVIFGQYEWDLSAFAKDNHVNQSPTEKGKDSWRIHVGLEPLKKTTGRAGGPKGSEPDAIAEVTFKADKPVGIVGQPGKLTTSMNILVEADIVPEVPKNNPNKHGEQNARGFAKSSMNVTTGTVSSVEISQPGAATVVINANQFKGSVGFGADTGTGKLKDPLSITLNDLTAGTSITEDLFISEFTGIVNGEWSWDSSGISLNVPLDGVSSASILLNFPSSWITDTSLVNSMVSLENGIFNTSGLFDGLPWVVTETSASLSGGILDSILIPYQIPDEILDDDHLYEAELINDLSAEISATASVPEPNTILGLLTIGGITLGTCKKTKLNNHPKLK